MKGIIEQWNEFSTGLKVISLIMVCCIGLVIVAGIIGVFIPDLNTSQQMINTLDGNSHSSDKIADSNGKLQVKITCPVAWSASISAGNSTDSYEGTGTEIIDVDKSDVDAIGVAAHKKTEGSDQLKIEIIKDGKVIGTKSTKTTNIISTSASVNDNSGTGSSSSDDGVKIKITSPVAWSASIGDTDTTVQHEGTGSKVINIDESRYDTIAAAVQKKPAETISLKLKLLRMVKF